MNKNTFFILLSFIFFAHNVSWSQGNVHESVDSLLLTVNYQVDYYDYIPKDETLNPEDLSKDVIMLQVGRNITRSYSEKEKLQDQRAMEFAMKKGKRTVDIWNLKAQFGEIYKNYPKRGKQTVVMNMQAAGMYQYEESMPVIKWSVGKEKKEILGYTCLSATAEYRGRSYRAWFCPDIPLSYGPLWFDGLPGLILEIADTQGHYHFVCTGIEKPKNAVTITYWKRGYHVSTRNKCRKMQTAFLRYPSQFFADYGVTVRMDGEDLPPMPNNPIELK